MFNENEKEKFFPVYEAQIHELNFSRQITYRGISNPNTLQLHLEGLAATGLFGSLA